MKTIALIERGKDGTFGICTPNINATIIGEGNTVEEAKADFMNSLSEVLKMYEESGKIVPEELSGIEFEFRYDIASLFNYFDFINVSKFAKRAGINSSLMRQYKSGLAYISESQAKKIENELHAVAKELLSVSL